MVGCRQIIALVVAQSLSVNLAISQTASAASRPVIFNLDASEFFVETFGPVVPKTIDKYVKTMSGTGVTDLFVCVNMQRTNYRSSVWESDWDGYDPKGGDNQPFFAGIAPERGFERDWYRNSYRWSLLGADYPELVLSAARTNGMRGWISVRMNDAHYPKQPLHPYHSSFWRQHPDWYLPNFSLDYSNKQVRDHYFALIQEVLNRYDMHGLELDFMRHGFYFRAEGTHDGVSLMNGFLRDVRALVKQQSRKREHTIELAVRVPSTPWIAIGRGLDAVQWARESLVDWVIASPWWASTQNDVPVEEWRGSLKDLPVRLSVALEDGISSGITKRRTLNVEEARGIAASSLYRGVDAVYLFNWFTGPLHEWPSNIYREYLEVAGNLRALQQLPRRYPVTMIDPWFEGQPGTPRPLTATDEVINLRIPIGPAPALSDAVTIAVGLKSGISPTTVRLNSKLCTAVAPDKDFLIYRAPVGAVRDGYNLLQITTDKKTTLSWVEIRISPVP